MATRTSRDDLAERVRDFVLDGFTPQFGQLTDTFGDDPSWRRLKELGGELWLDTGDIDDAAGLWTKQFSALTTNNTLLNKEVQKGTYDDLIPAAAGMLARYELPPEELVLEIAFILNARHALKLVERFDAFVSVEEHTDFAHNVDGAVEVARRYHAICPERFYVKVPFTPSGLLATRRLSREGIPVNHTLGFAARQNYLIARVARPRFVNVFLGRLNSFVADNDLGPGALVGERAMLASQAAVSELRRTAGIGTRQIGASFRSGGQVRDLVGIDVMTMPPKVAREFLALGIAPDALVSRVDEEYRPPLHEEVDEREVGLHTLWEVPGELVACVDALEAENLDRFGADDLINFFAAHGCGDVLVRWTAQQVRVSREEGKIPRLANWRQTLESGIIGLDALMNLAGLNSFAADQAAMDDRVRQMLHVPAGR
ncbi:MAG TPA: transaldolase family protein [Phycisphaerae bacterium]|nr:transaldolase family protein [Phycisphaerae bacterium]